MADKTTDDATGADKAAMLRTVRAEAGRLGKDAASLGRSVREFIELRARRKPIQTVAVALAIGWLVGKRL